MRTKLLFLTLSIGIVAYSDSAQKCCTTLQNCDSSLKLCPTDKHDVTNPGAQRSENSNPNSSSVSSASLKCDQGLEGLKKNFPLVSPHSFNNEEVVLTGHVYTNVTRISYTKAKGKDLSKDFDRLSSVWLAHALACKDLNFEDLHKYMEKELPAEFINDEVWSESKKQWLSQRSKRTFDNAERYLRPQEKALAFKIFNGIFSKDSEMAALLGEQLLELAKAQGEKRDPILNENLKAKILALGKKFKAGDIKNLSESDKALISFIAEEKPFRLEKIFGSFLTASMRTLFLAGEQKVAEKGSGIYSTDKKDTNFILSGKGIVPKSLEDAFAKFTNPKDPYAIAVRNDTEDKTLFWNDPKHTVLADINQLKEPQKSQLRKWARDRFNAIEEGKVEGSDPLIKEALVNVIAALEGDFDREKKQVALEMPATLHDTLSSQREKIASAKDGEKLSESAETLSQSLKKNHGIELSENARNSFLQLGSLERKLVQEMAQKPKDQVKVNLKELLADLNSTSVTELTKKYPEIRSSFYEQIKKDLAIKNPLLQAKVNSLIDSLKKADPSQNDFTVAKSKAVRFELINELKEAVKDEANGQIKAEALAKLINLSDEVGLSEEQTKAFDAVRAMTGNSHYSVPITMNKVKAEEDSLKVVRNELQRVGKKSTQEVADLINELYPKGMGIPSHTRVLLSKLLLPENEVHLEMLKRLKTIADLREKTLSPESLAEMKKQFQAVLLNPDRKIIENAMNLFNPKAFEFILNTQGDKHRQALLKKIMLEPEVFAKTVNKLAQEDAKLDNTPNGEGDLANALLSLVGIEYLKAKGALGTIVDPDLLFKLSESNDFDAKLYGDIQKNVIASLISNGSHNMLRGEGFSEVSKLPQVKRDELAVRIRKIANDIGDDVTNEDILASLNSYNQVGKKVRAELDKLIGQSSNTPPNDLSVVNTLSGVLNRQLQKLSLDINQENRVFEKEYQTFEQHRTEHRNVGKEEWDKQVKNATYYWDEKKQEDKNLTSKYWMDSYVRQLDIYKKKKDEAEQRVIDAKNLKSVVMGEEGAQDPSKKITNLGMLTQKLGETENVYLSDLETRRLSLTPEQMKAYEIALRKKMVEEYVSGIYLPKGIALNDTVSIGGISESDKEEVRRKVDSYLSRAHKQFLIRKEREDHINGFIDRNYGANLASIKDEKERDVERKSLFNLVNNTVANANESRNKVKSFVESAAENFDSLTGGEAFDKNMNSAFYKRLRSQLQNEVVQGQNVGLKLTNEQLNQQITSHRNSDLEAQKKTDSDTLQAIRQLEALGLGFDGTSVVLKPSSKLHYAHRPTQFLNKKDQAKLKASGMTLTDGYGSGGDAEMIQKENERRFKGLPLPLTGANGDEQFMKALDKVNKAGIPLKIDHETYKVTNTDGKRLIEDFMETLFDRVNKGNSKYTLPLGENDAVEIKMDQKTGKMVYTLLNRKVLSASLQKCMDDVEKKRDTHQLAQQRAGGYSGLVDGIGEGLDRIPEFYEDLLGSNAGKVRKEFASNTTVRKAWKEYTQAVERCSGYGTIDNGKGKTGQDFADSEAAEREHQHQIGVTASNKFLGNVEAANSLNNAAMLAVATYGTSLVATGLVTAGKIGWAANSAKNLSLGQKLFFNLKNSAAAQKLASGARIASDNSKLINTSLGFAKWGGNTLLKAPQAINAGSKIYARKYAEGAAWALAPNPVIYGAANIGQWHSMNKAEKLFREGKFKAPLKGDYTEAEYEKALKNWKDLVASTDINDNGTPDSLDRMGNSWILPDFAETANATAGGGEFFGGMGAVHALFPKLPGISYLSVFSGSLLSGRNRGALGEEEKSWGKALKDATAGTVGMAPGLVFMNHAHHLYKIPGMRTQFGLGNMKISGGRAATMAGIHFANSHGHIISEELGLTPHTPHAPGFSEMGWSDLTSFAVNEAIGYKFAGDMSKASHLRDLARQLAPPKRAANNTNSSSTNLSVPQAENLKGKPAAEADSFDNLVKKYGKADVNNAIHMIPKKELLNSNNPELLKRAAASVGMSPEQLKETLDFSINGTNGELFKQLGVVGATGITSPANAKSFLAPALERAAQLGKGAQYVLDGPQGFSHDLFQMNKKLHNTVFQIYKANTDPAKQLVLADYLLKNPQMLTQIKAKDLKFSKETENADGYIAEQLANQSAYGSTNQSSERAEAIAFNTKVKGRSYNAYSTGFALYVRSQIKDGSARENTMGQMLERYNRMWDSGEFNETLSRIRRQRASASN